MLNVGEKFDAFNFSKEIKRKHPDKPVVVLTPFSREISLILEKEDLSAIDYVFSWLGNADILLAIIKLLEDKMNIDTDTQWAYWDGVREYAKYHHDYLQGQIGNPEGEDKPNKSHYDPRKWLRAAELSMVARLEQAFDDLNCIGRN